MVSMRSASLWISAAVRAGIAAIPVAPSARVVERAARRYAELAVRTRRLPLFRGARSGTVPAPGHRRVIEDRFTLKMLNWFDEVRPLSLGRGSETIGEIVGQAQLESALEQGRGVVLVTGHFGFPPAIRAALDATSTPWLTLRQLGLRTEGVALGTESWARVRALRRAREALGRNHACILLADGGQGAAIRVPFLERHLDVSLGAFALARAAACPILPFFVPLTDGPARLRVEIGAPLSLDDWGTATPSAVRSFAAAYATYARRYPSSTYWASSRAAE
jgi:hypothetical protein